MYCTVPAVLTSVTVVLVHVAVLVHPAPVALVLPHGSLEEPLAALAAVIESYNSH